MIGTHTSSHASLGSVVVRQIHYLLPHHALLLSYLQAMSVWQMMRVFQEGGLMLLWLPLDFPPGCDVEVLVN